MMKNRASVFLKQIVSTLISIVKSKSMAVKSKTSEVKTRLIIFGLLRNKKLLMTTISHKLQALTGHHHHHEKRVSDESNVDSKAVVLYNSATAPALTETSGYCLVNCADDDEYPDLTHTLFDEGGDIDDDDDDDGDGSAIDYVRNTREDSKEFSLEDEIDHVADVFIRRFHKQMRLQKQESFKRYQEMLDRSV
ncbi:hypothetical protein QJS04_geneDACA021062 [Acorus gramineus]|uniref:Cotton fiber protein n=1 Tax=Acorus gramineus TaxID=55184 RepID=A0AAV9B292_ACOGR|nr:hypothetical protein QJS04_geneDACA021062 [Acorus gramineus]